MDGTKQLSEVVQGCLNALSRTITVFKRGGNNLPN